MNNLGVGARERLRTVTLSVFPSKTRKSQTLAEAADWLAVGVAASLPWSTSATGILIALWLVAVLPTLDLAGLRREVESPAGGVPVLLWLFGALGMLWADVTWSERLGGLGGFNKLLCIPLLLTQFRQSAHGARVLCAFLISALVLLLLSWTLALFPGFPWSANAPGVPVKDYIMQSIEFVLCAFALFDLAFGSGRAGRWAQVAGLLALALVLLADVFFVTTGRTVLLVLPFLIVLLGWRQFGGRGVLGAVLLGVVVAALVWTASPYMRQRLSASITDFHAYLATDAPNSTGLHLEFLRKSISFVATAPVFGHGTGSIPEQFRNAAVAQSGAAAVASVNPHNQILAVAIQIGLAGAAILAAMWIAHLALFRGATLIDWIGLMIVTQNIVASSFNSHLFDFGEGWLYVFGVGVTGGIVLRQQDHDPPLQP